MGPESQTQAPQKRIYNSVITNNGVFTALRHLRFSRAVLEVQQRASLKTALLEAKLKNLEGRDLNPREIHELLKMKDNQVEDLRYEAARLRKAHDDLLATYEAKLTKLGVPLEELGFKPLKAVAVAGVSPVIGQCPAGLVAKEQI
ncbi:jg2235 [Pararge aegeria aegeria]|uniref:Jg2235 protein n=1 Tax=Pararge aegeria aegeria TaxID=348720 RepID=A0A8S4SPQ9_9NEOP|nr:jg2235 [Pararge aegeria aegeria]